MTAVRGGRRGLGRKAGRFPIEPVVVFVGGHGAAWTDPRRSGNWAGLWDAVCRSGAWLFSPSVLEKHFGKE